MTEVRNRSGSIATSVLLGNSQRLENNWRDHEKTCISLGRKPVTKYQRKLRFHGPKEELDAARSPDTSVDELAILAESQYSFVLTAVAENPNTDPFTLAGLIPLSIQSYPDQALIVALARNGNTPPLALSRLAEAVLPFLDNQRDRYSLFEAGVALCCNPATPLEEIIPMVDPERSATEFRKVVARETRRKDVLGFLVTDRSEIVRKQAKKSLDQMEDAADIQS
jgi:hypothetical protein